MNFEVLDDFLDHGSWSQVWSDLQVCDLWPIHRSSGAWKLDDGVPLGGEEIIVPKGGAAEEHEAAPIVNALAGASDAIDRVTCGEWDRVSARTYIYPESTALSWHSDDSELYVGAFIYYAHPEWDAHWGGELMLVDGGDDLDLMGHRFAAAEYSEALLARGGGQFLFPVPNRLVLLGGDPHQVAAVRRGAGDRVRATVSGFFLRPE